MRSQLRAIGTKQARALGLAFDSFGDFPKFVNRLPATLGEVYEPLKALEQKYVVYVARLGAEAFVFDAPRIEEDNRFLPWVDYPDVNRRLDPTVLPSFIHFSMRRLRQLSRIATRPETHRRQIGRAHALFRFFQAELAPREFRYGLNEGTLQEYRTLVVKIFWLHYQRLVDGWLESAAKSRLDARVSTTRPAAVVAAPVRRPLDLGSPGDARRGRSLRVGPAITGEWPNVLQMAAITAVFDAETRVQTFNLTPTLYRDYFDREAAYADNFAKKAERDLRYRHYTPKPPPFTGRGPDTLFDSVYRRRLEQKALIDDLLEESGTAPIPRMEDSASWQEWVRGVWDKPVLRREHKLRLIVGFVNRYFHAFTIHSPHDLREGCAEENYLTRSYPRAVTGALVHDCVVYACRWLHILGRLLAPGSLPEGIAKPRIFLIEMPAHVGVMIRIDSFNAHLVVGANNGHASIHATTDKDEEDKYAAEDVVSDMYAGMKTPYIVRQVKSNPSSATALWRELCKLVDKSPDLPYRDAKFPPYLRYLKHNALSARIANEFSQNVRVSWQSMRQNLEGTISGADRPELHRVKSEVRMHSDRFKALQKVLESKIKEEIAPLVKEIDDDLEANRKRLPKDALIVQIARTELFRIETARYQAALDKAVQSGDLKELDPSKFFPESDFAAAVE